jgi:hypothetical protein
LPENFGFGNIPQAGALWSEEYNRKNVDDLKGWLGKIGNANPATVTHDLSAIWGINDNPTTLVRTDPKAKAKYGPI